eukprot:m.359118 g.359118  ORF g.359118 m.359118 type:complete len:2453 (+) comp16626_c5_seq2:180-7538(+)
MEGSFGRQGGVEADVRGPWHVLQPSHPNTHPALSPSTRRTSLHHSSRHSSVGRLGSTPPRVPASPGVSIAATLRELTMRAERKKESEFGQASVLLLEQQQRELQRKDAAIAEMAARQDRSERDLGELKETLLASIQSRASARHGAPASPPTPLGPGSHAQSHAGRPAESPDGGVLSVSHLGGPAPPSRGTAQWGSSSSTASGLTDSSNGRPSPPRSTAQWGSSDPTPGGVPGSHSVGSHSAGGQGSHTPSRLRESWRAPHPDEKTSESDRYRLGGHGPPEKETTKGEKETLLGAVHRRSPTTPSYPAGTLSRPHQRHSPPQPGPAASTSAHPHHTLHGDPPSQPSPDAKWGSDSTHRGEEGGGQAQTPSTPSAEGASTPRGVDGRLDETAATEWGTPVGRLPVTSTPIRSHLESPSLRGNGTPYPERGEGSHETTDGWQPRGVHFDSRIEQHGHSGTHGSMHEASGGRTREGGGGGGGGTGWLYGLNGSELTPPHAASPLVHPHSDHPHHAVPSQNHHTVAPPGNPAERHRATDHSTPGDPHGDHPHHAQGHRLAQSAYGTPLHSASALRQAVASADARAASYAAERDAAVADRDAARAELDAARDALSTERDAAEAERRRLTSEHRASLEEADAARRALEEANRAMRRQLEALPAEHAAAMEAAAEERRVAEQGLMGEVNGLRERCMAAEETAAEVDSLRRELAAQAEATATAVRDLEAAQSELAVTTASPTPTTSDAATSTAPLSTIASDALQAERVEALLRELESARGEAERAASEREELIEARERLEDELSAVSVQHAATIDQMVESQRKLKRRLADSTLSMIDVASSIAAHESSLSSFNSSLSSPQGYDNRGFGGLSPPPSAIPHAQGRQQGQHPPRPRSAWGIEGEEGGSPEDERARRSSSAPPNFDPQVQAILFGDEGGPAGGHPAVPHPGTGGTSTSTPVGASGGGHIRPRGQQQQSPTAPAIPSPLAQPPLTSTSTSPPRIDAATAREEVEVEEGRAAGLALELAGARDAAERAAATAGARVAQLEATLAEQSSQLLDLRAKLATFESSSGAESQAEQTAAAAAAVAAAKEAEAQVAGLTEALEARARESADAEASAAESARGLSESKRELAMLGGELAATRAAAESRQHDLDRLNSKCQRLGADLTETRRLLADERIRASSATSDLRTLETNHAALSADLAATRQHLQVEVAGEAARWAEAVSRAVAALSAALDQLEPPAESEAAVVSAGTPPRTEGCTNGVNAGRGGRAEVGGESDAWSDASPRSERSGRRGSAEHRSVEHPPPTPPTSSPLRTLAAVTAQITRRLHDATARASRADALASEVGGLRAEVAGLKRLALRVEAEASGVDAALAEVRADLIIWQDAEPDGSDADESDAGESDADSLEAAVAAEAEARWVARLDAELASTAETITTARGLRKRMVEVTARLGSVQDHTVTAQHVLASLESRHLQAEAALAVEVDQAAMLSAELDAANEAERVVTEEKRAVEAALEEARREADEAEGRADAAEAAIAGWELQSRREKASAEATQQGLTEKLEQATHDLAHLRTSCDEKDAYVLELLQASEAAERRECTLTEEVEIHTAALNELQADLLGSTARETSLSRELERLAAEHAAVGAALAAAESSAAEATAKAEALEEEVASVRQSLESTEATTITVQRESQAKEAEVQRLTVQVESLTAELDAALADKSGLSRSLSRAETERDAEVTRLHSELATAEAVLSDAAARHKSADAAAARAEAARVAAVDHAESLKRELAEALEEVAECRSLMETQAAELKGLEMEGKAAARLAEERAAELGEAVAKAGERHAKAETALEEALEEVEARRAQAERLQTRVGELEAAEASALGKLSSALEALTHDRASLTAAQTSLADAQGSLAAAADALESERAATAALQRKVDALTHELAQATASAETARTEATDLTAAFASLEASTAAEKASLAGELAAARAEAETAEGEVLARGAELAELTQTLESRESAVRAIMAREADAREQVAEVERQLAQGRTALAEARGVHTALSHERDSAQARCDEATSALSDLEKSHARLDADLAKATAELEALRSQTTAGESATAALESRAVELETELARLAQTLSDRDGEIETLRHRLSEYGTRLAAAEAEAETACAAETTKREEVTRKLAGAARRSKQQATEHRAELQALSAQHTTALQELALEHETALVERTAVWASERVGLERTAEQLRAELGALERKVAEATRDAAAARADCETAAADATFLTSDLAAARQAVATAQTELREGSAREATLVESLAAAVRRAEGAERKAADAAAARAREAAGLEERVETVRSELRAAMAQCESLRARNASLAARVDALAPDPAAEQDDVIGAGGGYRAESRSAPLPLPAVSPIHSPAARPKSASANAGLRQQLFMQRIRELASNADHALHTINRSLDQSAAGDEGEAGGSGPSLASTPHRPTAGWPQ